MRKIILIYTLSFTFVLGSLGSLMAKQEKAPAGPSKALNLNGTWDFQTSDHKAYGTCEAGEPHQGKLRIFQQGDKLKLVFLSGPIVCSPPDACEYQGKLKSGQAYFHNAAVAQGSRGSLLNSIHLEIKSNLSASGDVRSIKQSIGGSMCEWTHRIQLNRKTRKKG